jgi:hypothetical protein
MGRTKYFTLADRKASAKVRREKYNQSDQYVVFKTTMILHCIHWQRLKVDGRNGQRVNVDTAKNNSCRNFSSPWP